VSSLKKKKKKTPPFSYLAIYGALRIQFRKSDILPTIITSCSSRRKTSLTQSSPYTLTNHKGRCMSHVISMHRPGDPRQTGVRDFHSTIAALIKAEISLATVAIAFFSKLLKNCIKSYLMLMYSNVTPKNRMNLIG
jgi:hypothetical protein